MDATGVAVLEAELAEILGGTLNVTSRSWRQADAATIAVELLELLGPARCRQLVIELDQVSGVAS